MKKCCFVILLIFGFGITGWTQSANSVRNLKSIGKFLEAGKVDIVEQKLLSVNVDELINATDSVLYYYHYYYASLLDIKEICQQYKIAHLLTAKEIREKSLGILDPEYIELLWALGSTYEDIDIDKAIYFLRKGVIVGLSLLPDRTIVDRIYLENTLGMTLGDLAGLYEQKGRSKEVVALYENAFALCSRFYERGDEICWYYKFMLASYYSRKKDYVNSIRVITELINYFEEHGECDSKGYIDCIFFKAADLGKIGKIKDAIQLYWHSIELIYEYLDMDYEGLNGIYSNLYIALIEEKDYFSSDSLGCIFRNYCVRNNKLFTYVQTLLGTAIEVKKIGEYCKAKELLDTVFLYREMLNSEELKLLYSAKVDVFYHLKNFDDAIYWQTKVLSLIKERMSVSYFRNMLYMSDIYMQAAQEDMALDICLVLKQGLEGLESNDISVYMEVLQGIASIYQKTGGYEKEEKFWSEVVRSLRNKDDIIPYAYVCNVLGVLQMNNNKFKNAKKYFNKADKIFHANFGASSNEYAIILHNKGRLCMLQEKYERAWKLLMKSKFLQNNLNGTVNIKTERYLQQISPLKK